MTQNTKNYKKQGGDEWVVEGILNTENGTQVGEIQEVAIEMVETGDVVDKVALIASENYEVIGIKEVHSTAEATNTPNLQVEKLFDGEALGNGAALLTDNSDSGFDLTATADEVQEGSLVADGSQELSEGDRLGITISGSTAEIAGVLVQIELKRIE